MRLTLRTLLAYLDDVLPPAETELLHKQIDKSEFAATLVQRIRHAVKRLRLSAPKVDGKGIGYDPNSVADYLDSVLPTDRMSEFERVCLESDIHLSEVAACHQILCKVLKEPAHVSHGLKDRIHALPELVKSGKVPPPSARHSAEPVMHASPLVPAEVKMSEAAPPAAQKAAVERPKMVVPDYLKPEPSQSRWQLFGVLGFMAIAAAVLLMMSPLGQQFVPWKMFGGTNEISQNLPTNNLPTPNDNSAPKNNEAEGKQPPLDKLKPLPNDSKIKEPENGNPPLPDDEAPPLAAVGPPKKPVAPPDDMPEKPTENEVPADPDTKQPMPEISAPPSTEKEPALGGMGKYISDETVLARFDKASKNWVRLAPRSLVQSGEKLVSLPVYRPQIQLASGVQVTLVGDASVAFDRVASSPLISLQADYGKFLLVTAGVPEAALELNLNGIRGQLSLASADAEAAVELFSYLPPGEDPATGASLAVAYVYALSGSVTWRGADGELVPIKTSHVRAFVAGKEPLVRGPLKLPSWIDARKTPQLERDAAKVSEPLLSLERPLVLALEELASHRKIEVRTHVARCLGSLESYQVLLRHLSEEEYRAYWPAEIEVLRSQAARGGKFAQELESQIDKLRGVKEGDLLYRLLWGFNEQQLLAQEAENLVGLLENIHPDVRLLAFDNLKRITGVTHSYNPAYTPDKNRSALVRWSKARKEGEIAYAVKPSPLGELQTLATKAEPAAEK